MNVLFLLAGSGDSLNEQGLPRGMTEIRQNPAGKWARRVRHSDRIAKRDRATPPRLRAGSQLGASAKPEGRARGKQLIPDAAV